MTSSISKFVPHDIVKPVLYVTCRQYVLAQYIHQRAASVSLPHGGRLRRFTPSFHGGRRFIFGRRRLRLGVAAIRPSSQAIHLFVLSCHLATMSSPIPSYCGLSFCRRFRGLFARAPRASVLVPIMQIVVELSSAFPPLQFAASGLLVVLKTVEVRHHASVVP